jgi:thiamine-monophosphate kinase
LPSGEQPLIAHIRSHTKGRTQALRTGIGDDCAVLRVPRGHETLVTTDFSLEGVHFRRDWHSPESAGHRCLARGLSDIAAMGGDPLAAFLSLAFPGSLDPKWVERFLSGLLRLASKFNVPLAGGDIAESPGGICADIVVVGSVPAGKALLRSGAKPGDSIFVTGQLGNSAAVVHGLREDQKISPKATEAAPHFWPIPRIEAGRALRGLATAAIDISDGLSTDLSHLCQESGVGAVIAEHSIPRGVSFRGSSLHFALHGGEDYELLFTAAAKARVPQKLGGVRVTRIGEIVADRRNRILLSDSHGQRKQITPAGWQHFASASGRGSARDETAG